jgi:hypothetical protein
MPSLEQIAKGAKASGLNQKDFESRILANPRYSGVSREDIAAAWGGGLKKKDQPSGISSPGGRMESTESPSLSAQVPAPTQPTSVSEVAPSLSRQQGLSDLSKQKPASTSKAEGLYGIKRNEIYQNAALQVIQENIDNGYITADEVASLSQTPDKIFESIAERKTKESQLPPPKIGGKEIELFPNQLKGGQRSPEQDAIEAQRQSFSKRSGATLKVEQENELNSRLQELTKQEIISKLPEDKRNDKEFLKEIEKDLFLNQGIGLDLSGDKRFNDQNVFKDIAVSLGAGIQSIDYGIRSSLGSGTDMFGLPLEAGNILAKQGIKYNSTQFEQDVFDAMDDGDFENAARITLNVTANSLPIMAVSAASSFAGGPAASYATLAALSAAQTYGDVKDEEWFKEMSDIEALGYVSAMGGTEAFGEIFGGRMLTRAMRSIATSAGKEIAEKTFKEYIKGVAKAGGVNFYENYLGEAFTGASQYVVDNFAKGEDITAEGIIDAAKRSGASGLGMAGAITTAGAAVSTPLYMANKVGRDFKVLKLNKAIEAKRDAILSAETPDERYALAKDVLALTNERDGAVKSSVNFFDKMSKDDQAKVYALTLELQETAKVRLESTNEEARDSMQKQILSAYSQVKEIIKKYENDSQEGQQVPGTQQTGEAPIQAQPVQEAGRKETPAGRVVQEPKQEVGTVRSLINRKATYSDPVSETIVEGDVYQDGQRVILETAEGKIFDIGNIDEMQDKSPREFGLMEAQERISVNDDGSFVYNGGDNQKIAGGTVMVNRRDGLKSIKRGKDGAIKTVTLTSPDGTQTYNLTGQDAVDAAYQIVLNFSTSPEQSVRVEQLLNENEQAKREIQQAARAATEVVTAEPVAVTAPKKAAADIVDVAVGRDGAGVTVAKIATTKEIADRINKEPKKSPVYVATRRAAKSLKKLFPDAEYVFVDSDAEAADYYRQNMPNVAADENGSDKGRIIQNKNNGKIEIVINTSSADATTVYHELFHAAFYKAYAQDAKTAIDFSKRLAKVLDSGTAAEKAIAKRVNDHVAKYKGDPEGVVSEEFLSELAGILAADAKSITQGMAAKIANFINNIAKKIGIGPVFTEAATTKEVVDFMNSFAAAAREGGNVVQDIANSEAATAVFRPSSTKSVKKIDIKETRDGFTRLEKFPTNTKSPFEFAGETFITTQSDRLAAGEQVLPNGEKITLRGGFGYPAMTNYVWAASELGKAKTLAGQINRQIKEVGYALLSPLVMAESSHKGNYTYFTAAMSLVNSAADKKKLSNKKFLEVVKSAAKTAKVDASSVNANTVKENVDILMNLFSVEGGTFKKRSDFIEALLGNTTKKGGVHKPNLPGVITSDQLADITADPLLKGLQGAGYIMSVIKITKPVKTRNTSASEDGFTFHESYPAIIESTDDKDPGVELFVFDDAFGAVEVLPAAETSTGKIISLEARGGNVNLYQMDLGLRNIPVVTKAKFIVSATTQDDGRMPADEAVARLDNLSSRSSKLNYDKKGFDSNELMYLSMSNRKKSEIENIIKSGTYAFLTAENPRNEDITFGTAFDLQDKTAERTVSDKAAWGDSGLIRERTENAGDILRELSSRGESPDPRYLQEKIDKLRAWIGKNSKIQENAIPIDIETINDFNETNLRFSNIVDGFEYLMKFNSGVVEKIKSEYEAIPTYTNEQKLAKDTVLALLSNDMGGLNRNLNRLQDIVDIIKKEGKLKIVKSVSKGSQTSKEVGTRATVSENEAYMKDAKVWLSERGYNYTSIYGVYDNKENSFFVPYMTFEDAEAFRKEFNQESVAHSDGLIYSDYYNPRVREKNSFDVDYKSEDNNYYSVFRDSKNEVFGVSTTYDYKKSPSLEEGLKKAKTKKETIIEILEESGKYALNDDGKGNFAFFHYGNIEGPAIKGSFFGKNKYTSDKRYYKPVSMYYTRRGESEPMVQIAGRKPHVVLIPKDKVYPFNADPMGFYDEAHKRFVLSLYPSGEAYGLTVEKDLHKFSFPSDAQAAFIGEVAKENGYLMMVAAWNSMGIPTRGESQVDLEYDVEATKTYRETNEARIYPGEDLKDIPITDFMYRSSKSTQASDAAREAADQYYKDGGNIKPGTMDKIKASVYSSLFRTPEQMEVLKMKETKDSMISRQNLKIRKMAERLQDLIGKNADGAALVTEYLSGPNADNISAIEDLKNGSKILDAATEMRALIDQMSGQIVNGPAFAAMNRELKEVILGNMGTYLKTSYRFWKDKKFKVTDAAIRTASEHVYDLLRARKLQTLLKEDLMPQEVDKIMNDSKEQLFNEAQKQILDYVREIEKIRSAPKYKGMGVVSTGQIKIPGESFKQRKDIPFYIQDLLGVEKDPQIRFVDTAIALSNILYKGEMAAKMANAFGNDFFISDDVITKEDRESGRYKQVKDEYSPLNRMWIPNEIFEIVNNEDIYASENAFMQYYFNALKLARKSKVIYNLPTWRKNITGGWQIIMANGVLNPQFIKDLANRPAFTVKGKETAEMTAILDEMAQYGLIGTDVNANIINGVDAMYSGILRGDYSVVEKTWNVMKSVDKKLAERYSSIDDYTKMVIYRTKRDSFAKKLFGAEYDSLNQSQQAKVRETAAEEVKQTTPTFSRLPSIYKKFAKTPFGDFLSFKIEAVRSLSMIIKTASSDVKKAMDPKLSAVQRTEYARSGLAKFLGAFGAISMSYVIPSMIESALGFDDEDETEDMKLLRPNWMSGDNLIVKKADSNGNISVYDLTMEDTYGEISSIIVNGSKGNVSEVMKVFGDIVKFNMVVTSVTNLAEGKDQYGRDMFESYDGAAVKLLETLKYLGKEFVVPPFLYSSIRDAGYKAEQTGENVFMLAGENILKRSVIRDYQYNMGQQFYFNAVGLAEGVKKDEQFTNLSGAKRDNRFADVDMIKQQYEAIVRYGNIYGNRDMISSAKSVIKKYYNKEEERYILYGQLN